MSEQPISEAGAIQHMTKAFTIYMTVAAYEGLPERHGAHLPVPDQLYRDSEHPATVFKCRGSATNWHRYQWDAFPWRPFS